MQRWRVLTTWDREAGWNMALDEALLAGLDPRPTLRFYTWKQPTLSLGYFQRVAEVPALARAPVAVRRLTGGGAIHHANELTFSIATTVDDPLYRGPVRTSYERVHGRIAETLARFGVHAAERGERLLDSDRPDTGMCFEHSTDIDLAWDGRKGVGSAQRRTGGRVLHHGSIKLDRSELDTQVAGIRAHAPGVDASTLAAALVEGFAADFDAFEPGEVTAAEAERANERSAHFTGDAFLRRR